MWSTSMKLEKFENCAQGVAAIKCCWKKKKVATYVNQHMSRRSKRVTRSRQRKPRESHRSPPHKRGSPKRGSRTRKTRSARRFRSTPGIADDETAVAYLKDAKTASTGLKRYSATLSATNAEQRNESPSPHSWEMTWTWDEVDWDEENTGSLEDILHNLAKKYANDPFKERTIVADFVLEDLTPPLGFENQWFFWQDGTNQEYHHPAWLESSVLFQLQIALGVR